MLNEKEKQIFEIIKNLHHELDKSGLGLPLGELFRSVKNKGIYSSDKFIGEKLRKLEKLGYIKVVNWNITFVDRVREE
jgi:hypothetical protein